MVLPCHARDFGAALTNKRDMLKEITPKFDNTMFLAGYAAVVAVPLAVGMGIVAAIRQGGGSTGWSTSSP